MREPAGEAAHIRSGSIEYGKPPTGMGEKPHDQWTVPLCHDCHLNPKTGQHAMNEMVFWQRLGVNVFGLAMTLWSLTGKHAAARRAVLDFRNWKRSS